MSNKSIYYAGWRYCHPVAMWADVRSDLVTPGLQPLEAALALHRDAELANVREELHDLGVSGARGVTDGHCVVSEEEMLWRHSSQWTGETVREREKPVCRSHSSVPHSSHAQQAGSSVSQEARDISLVQFCQLWSLIGRKKEAWVYVLWLWPSLKWSFRNSKKN